MKSQSMVNAALHPAIYSYMRHFPLEKGKRRLLNSLGNSLIPEQPLRQTRLKVAGIQMECDLSRFIQRHLYYLGHYEAEQIAFWMQCARQAKVIFDVGANVGLYSLAAAASHPGAAIHAFEPTPELVERFRTNIALNQFDHNAVNAIAVGQQSGEIYLHYSGVKDGANEGMNYVSPETGRATDCIVPMISLDDYCQQQQIGSIDLLKIDIEGHEYNALRGAENLLRQSAIDCIFMELNSWAVERSGHTLSDIITLLSDYDYRFYEIHNDHLVEISDRRLLVDINVIVTLAVREADVGQLPGHPKN